jgi:hypothetical protein
MKIAIFALFATLTVAACKPETNSAVQESNATHQSSVGTYFRVAPLTGNDSIGIGIGLELMPGIKMDLGSGNLNYGF